MFADSLSDLRRHERIEQQRAQPSPTALRSTWQQVRTTAARYAEANVLLAAGNYEAARTVIENMPVDKELRGPEILEQQRMLSYISLLKEAAGAGRSAAELNVSEVDQLKALIADQYDRPANWISNVLCLYYDECRSPRTGGHIGGEKSVRRTNTQQMESLENGILIAPNPTQTWATVTYSLGDEPIDGRILVKDLFGRVVLTERMTSDQGQVVLDTRRLSKGVYLVECLDDRNVLHSERLIVQ
jgi:hypothetical protein